MTKLTVRMLVARGYFKSTYDISRRIGISRTCANSWNYSISGKIPERYAEAIAKAADKPLTVNELDIQPGVIKKSEKPSKPIRVKRADSAQRVKSKDLSSWILAVGVISDDR